MTALSMLITVCLVGGAPKAPVTLDATRQLFLDDYLIASMTNVERLDDAGTPIARSTPIRRDNLDIEVQWESGRPDPAGGPVSLRIILKNALLFALWCS